MDHFVAQHHNAHNCWQIFRIGTVRYAEGPWRMRRHGPVIARCTDLEDFPNCLHLSSCNIDNKNICCLFLIEILKNTGHFSNCWLIIPSQFSTLMSLLWWYSTGYVLHHSVSTWKILQVSLLSLLPVQDITMMFHKDVCIVWFHLGCFHHAGTVFVLDNIRSTTTTIIFYCGEKIFLREDCDSLAWTLHYITL